MREVWSCLTSRPRESTSELFLNELLGLFCYPPGSARAQLAGTFGMVLLVLPVGPLLGGCLYLVMLLVRLLELLGKFRRLLLRVWVVGFAGLVVLVLIGEEFDLTENPLAHLAGFVVQSRPRVWKRLHHVGHSSVSLPDRKRRRRDQDDGDYVPAQVRTGVG